MTEHQVRAMSQSSGGAGRGYRFVPRNCTPPMLLIHLSLLTVQPVAQDL